MKITNGIDIIEIDRIKKNIEEKGDRFLKRIYTENEIKYCESKKNQRFESYAARFAAKESIFKALSLSIKEDYSWRDFEVLNDEYGRPKVNLKFKIENIENIEISLSHCKEYAIASVIATYKEN